MLAGIPEADGLVADLGGGSLDMVTVKDGQDGRRPITLPFGPLRLMDHGAKAIADKARDIVDKGLDALDMLGSLDGRAFMPWAASGAASPAWTWRSIGYPLHVLQDYEIPRARALQHVQGGGRPLSQIA